MEAYESNSRKYDINANGMTIYLKFAHRAAYRVDCVLYVDASDEEEVGINVC